MMLLIRKSQMAFNFTAPKHDELRTVHAGTRHMKNGASVQVAEHQRRSEVSDHDFHVNKFKEIAKKWGTTAAKERAMSFDASAALSREFGETAESFYKRKPELGKLHQWIVDGFPGIKPTVDPRVAQADKEYAEWQEKQKQPTMDTMVAQARRWKGAAMNADEDLGDDVRARLRHSRMTTKGDLDNYLMRKFGVDETTARDVSNYLTQHDIPADRTADPAEFEGEAWASPANQSGEHSRPWQQTKEQYGNDEDHAGHVFRALQHGKPVPAEVKAQYPEFGYLTRESKKHIKKSLPLTHLLRKSDVKAASRVDKDGKPKTVKKSIQHTPLLIKAARKLHGSIDFNGLQISIETGRSRCREWHDPNDGSQGMSRMEYPYGYIKKTQGIDKDHFDVFVGPDRTSQNVYIITTMRAPDFTEVDEQKAFLGCPSAEEAKRVFQASYNDPRFFGGMTEMPFAEFKEKVLATREEPKLLSGEIVKSQRHMPIFLLRKSQLDLFGAHHVEYTRINKNGTVVHVKAKGTPTEHAQGTLDFNAPIEPIKPAGPVLATGDSHEVFIANGKALFDYITGGFDQKQYKKEHDRLKDENQKASAKFSETLLRVKTDKFNDVWTPEIHKDPEIIAAMKPTKTTRENLDDHSRVFGRMRDKIIEHFKMGAPLDTCDIKAERIGRQLSKSQQKAMAEFFEVAGVNSLRTLEHAELMDKKFRAHASHIDRCIRLSPDDVAHTVWHECAHHIEFSHREIERAAQRFRDGRAQKDSNQRPIIKQINELDKTKHYGNDERAVKDKFISTYIGKVYFNGNTEVVSMGMGMLARTSEFTKAVSKDREFLHFTIGMLHYLHAKQSL
jgi:hypothetical protein